MQWYDEIIQVLLIGIANGAIIALIALGYTLVYGIIELIKRSIPWLADSRIAKIYQITNCQE